MTLEELRPIMISLGQTKSNFPNTELNSVIDLTLAKIADYANMVYEKCTKYAIDKSDEFIAYENEAQKIVKTIAEIGPDGKMLVNNNEYVVDMKKHTKEEVDNVNLKLNELYIKNKSLVDKHMMPTRLMYKYASSFQITDSDYNYIFSQNVSNHVYQIPDDIINDYKLEMENDDLKTDEKKEDSHQGNLRVVK